MQMKKFNCRLRLPKENSDVKNILRILLHPYENVRQGKSFSMKKFVNIKVHSKKIWFMLDLCQKNYNARVYGVR